MMYMVRERALLSAQSKPVLRTHVRLQFDPVREAWAVLAPERIFWPDDASLAILRLCDGENNTSRIIEKLSALYDTPKEVIAEDVEAFLQEWSDRFLVAL